VHGAAGDVGRKAGPGLELGTLVVGNIEARSRVGLGKEFEGGGLAGAGESEDAQRAGGIGVAGRDDGVLLGAGLQGDLPGVLPPAQDRALGLPGEKLSDRWVRGITDARYTNPHFPDAAASR